MQKVKTDSGKIEGNRYFTFSVLDRYTKVK